MIIQDPECELGLTFVSGYSVCGVCAQTMCTLAKNSRTAIQHCINPKAAKHCLTVCLSMSTKFTHLLVKILTTITARLDSSPLTNWNRRYRIRIWISFCQLQVLQTDYRMIIYRAVGEGGWAPQERQQRDILQISRKTIYNILILY